MRYRTATEALPMPPRPNGRGLTHFTLKKAGIDLPTVAGEPTKTRQTAKKRHQSATHVLRFEFKTHMRHADSGLQARSSLV